MSEKADSRKSEAVAVILDILDLMERVGYLGKQADRQYEIAFLYRKRLLNIEPWIYDVIPQASPRRLREWRHEYRHRGQGKRGAGHFSSASRWRVIVNRILAKHAKITPAEIHRTIERGVAWENAGWGTPEPPPSRRSVERYVVDVRHLESILPPGLLLRHLSEDKQSLGQGQTRS